MVQELIGSITMTLGIAMTVVALPSQIKKNQKEKKCGLTLLMILLPLSVYISRAVYALLINSLFIIIPDVLGIIFSSVILYQYIKYRNR